MRKKSGKKRGWGKWAALAAVAGAAAGGYALLQRREGQEDAENETTVTGPAALIPPQSRRWLAEHVRGLLPDGAVALVMNDDRGDLAHDMAAGCRMLFSADGDGCASAARPAWPRNIIRADCTFDNFWPAAQSLDAAVLVNVLQRQADPDAALAQLRRALKPTGVLVLAVTVRPEDVQPDAWREAMRFFALPVEQTWTQQELRTLLTGQGWEIEEEQLLEAGFPLVWLRCRVANP